MHHLCVRFLPAAMVAAVVSWCGPAAGREPADFSVFDSVVDPLLERMTLAEKVGQMTQVDLAGVKDRGDIGRLSLGSILSGGGSDPAEGNSRQAWADTYLDCQRSAMASRLGTPLLYGIDAVHGHNNVLGAVVFPHNIGLGCANDPDLVERIGRLTALEVRATGMEWAFAPCVTAARDDRWGRTYEGYSEDPERIGPLGEALVRGLQGDDPSDPTAVLACVKHFVGDGGTTAVVAKSRFKEAVGLTLDQGDTRCDEATLRRLHLGQYLPALEAGAGTVMPSYSSWNGVKCTMRHDLLTELLKEELGFEGFLISDYDAIDQCDPDYKTAIKLAINAGIDMAMVSKTYKEYITALTELAQEGAVPMSRIDDAVRRVLRVKAAMGLLEKGYHPVIDPAVAAEFGSADRRKVAREAVAKSLVLLKNDGPLPLAKSVKRVRVTGAGSDDIGVQCGGWTIDWQGKAGPITTGGTTILAGLREVAPGVEFVTDADAEGCDLSIVVVGEQPYAEGFGDTDDLSISAADRAAIATAAAGGKPVVLVVVSGRPLVLDDATLAAADAVVAAWLPGTEGAGVADVLCGRVAPTGTLSFTWPRSTDQQPINRGDAEYDPRFPYGFGLRYDAR